MKRRLLALMLSLVFSFALCSPAFATESFLADSDVPVVTGVLIISNPNTGEQWTWDVPAADILVSQASRSGNASGQVQEAEVSVDIGEYLMQTMSRTVDAEQVLHDNVTLTAGLSYSFDAEDNKISVSRAYGSAPHSGLYVVTSKVFEYKNPDIFDHEKYPTASSWSYDTDPTPGNYSNIVCPYAELTCRISVAGMENSYRDVTVRCSIDYLD